MYDFCCHNLNNITLHVVGCNTLLDLFGKGLFKFKGWSGVVHILFNPNKYCWLNKKKESPTQFLHEWVLNADADVSMRVSTVNEWGGDAHMDLLTDYNPAGAD